MENLFQVMPPLSADEFAELKADIAARGVMVPIEYDETGAVLDGHHRLKACAELGIKEWPSVVRLGMDTQAKTLHAIKLNCARRHLTTAGKQQAIQKALRAAPEKSNRQLARAIGVSHTTVAEQRGELEESGQIDHFSARQDPRTGRLSQPATKPISIAVAKPDQVAKVAAQAQIVIEQAASETVAKLAANDITLVQAQREVKEQKRELRREENRALIVRAAPLDALQVRFATIVADPPWDWGDEGDVDQMGRARPDYATMPYEKLLALPVAELADTDCHLYLWITNRSLPKGFALLEAWGFRYVTCLTWIKPSFGLGNYWRGQSEQVLFGIKGSQPLKRKDASTIFHAPRGPQGHSSKPVEFYALVESCSPGPYLELFSRMGRAGWTAWGESA